MTMYLFIIPIVVGTITQLSKRLFNPDWRSTVHVYGHALPRYGGMPSTHTSFAFSLATTTFLADGATSTSFAIAVALAIFILDDALRMRVYVGRHGQALRHLIETLAPERRKEFPDLEQRLGHSLPEVIAGAIVGVALTVLFYTFIG